MPGEKGETKADPLSFDLRGEFLYFIERLRASLPIVALLRAGLESRPPSHVFDSLGEGDDATCHPPLFGWQTISPLDPGTLAVRWADLAHGALGSARIHRSLPGSHW